MFGKILIVEFGGCLGMVKVGVDGCWWVQFVVLLVGGLYCFIVKGDQIVVLKDILIGDVWLLGGQFNMELLLVSIDIGLQEVVLLQNVQLCYL